MVKKKKIRRNAEKGWVVWLSIHSKYGVLRNGLA